MRLSRRLAAGVAMVFVLAIPAIAMGSNSSPTAANATMSARASAPDRAYSKAVGSLESAAPAVLAPSPTTSIDGVEVSPSLQSDGTQLDATGTLVDATIAKAPKDGFSVGAGGDGITIRPLGVDGTASEARIVNGDSAFYADTDPGADSVIRPTPDGIETFTQIRNASAPENYEWMLNLDSGEQFQLTPDGGANVVDASGAEVLKVDPPSAVDANGAPVPVSFTIAGSVLTLHVAHQRPSVAYPVIVDPHWGWVHVHRSWSYTQARSIGRALRDGGLGGSAIASLIGLAGGPVAAVVVGIIYSVGAVWVGNRILDANADSNGRGVNFDAGLRCVDIPYFPDPCVDALWIKPR
jgi:hypothetical protein